MFRYNPESEVFSLDSEADFSKYFDFILGEDRYRALKKVNPKEYKDLLEANKLEAMQRYEYYKDLSNKKA